MDGKIIDSKRSDFFKSKYDEGVILYFVEDGKIISRIRETVKQSIEPAEGMKLFYNVYLSATECPTIQEIFSQMSEKILNNKMTDEADTNAIITGLRTDSSGKPKDGILITPIQNNNYTLKSYLHGNLTQTIDNVSFDRIEEEIRKLEK